MIFADLANFSDIVNALLVATAAGVYGVAASKMAAYSPTGVPLCSA